MRNKFAPYIYIIIILVSGFGLMSTLVYYFLPLRKTTEITKLKVFNQKGASIVNVDVSGILSRNIFNIEGTFPNEAQNEHKERCGGTPTQSPLPYNISGIIYGGNGQSSVAVLKNRDTQEILIVKLNTKLPQKGYISDISADRVWIVSTGCPEYLELPKPKLPPSRVRHGNATQNVSDQSYSEPGFERIGTDTNVTRQWVDDILTNKLTTVLGEALATPHLVNGRIDGFTISQIDAGSVYDKLGLKNGDVVMSINNNPLNDAGQAIQTLNALRNERNIDMEVMRNGQIVSFRVNVQQ